MSTEKAEIDNNDILLFVVDKYHAKQDSLRPLQGGEVSQAFGFIDGNDRPLVIRISKDEPALDKDLYAATHYASQSLPIPAFLEKGNFNEMFFFAVTERVQGKTFNTLSPEEREAANEFIVNQLVEIHKQDIVATRGYGYWGANGMACLDSWSDHMLAAMDDETFGWEHYFKATFLDKNVCLQLFRNIEASHQYSPSERYLVHGDYGRNNLFFDGTKVTGVIDWGESKYGDFIYDIAWIDLWDPQIDYSRLFYNAYKELGFNMDHYNDRIKCSKSQIALMAMHFFARSEQLEKYMYIKRSIVPAI